MKKIYIVLVTTVTLIVTSAAYTADTADNEGKGSPPTINGGEEMHHEGMRHQGMMRQHMMHSGMSPVTVMIYPGMMPMMGHGMMHRGMETGHKSSSMHREKMGQHHGRKKEHMERMEQRLANIEKLLAELLEALQKKD